MRKKKDEYKTKKSEPQERLFKAKNTKKHQNRKSRHSDRQFMNDLSKGFIDPTDFDEYMEG